MGARLARNVPVVMQMEATECGAACLAMVLAHHGRWEPLDEVRRRCGVGRDGLSPEHLVRAAATYGLACEVLTPSADEVRELDVLPAIVGWGTGHFCVLRGFARGRAQLIDPARGSVPVSRREFREHFANVAITCTPSPAFERGGSRPSTVAFARERLHGMGPTIAFLALSTLAASLAAIIVTSLSSVFLDEVLEGRDSGWLYPLLWTLGAATLVQCAVGVVRSVALNRMRGKFAIVGSSRFMWHLLHLPMRFYLQRSTADLIRRHDSNETIAATLAEHVAPSLLNMSLLVLYLLVMVRQSPRLALMGVVCALVNALVANHVSALRLNVARQHERESAMLWEATIEGVESIETIRAQGGEDAYYERWAGLLALISETSERFSRTNLYLGSLPGFLTGLTGAAVLVVGTVQIMHGSLTAGGLLAFQGYLSAFMQPVDSLCGLGQAVQEVRSSMERVQDVLDHPAEKDEGATPGTAPTKLAGRLELDHVTFGYSPLDPPVVQDVSLAVEPGDWVAIVGASGSGKSTVAHLASGLYTPWSGEVRIDGIPLHQVDQASLRASLGVVDQNLMCFEDTVEANIRLWDRSIPDWEVIMATRDADLHDDIMGRRLGYGEPVKAGGTNFSGGELQRMEIARALAQDPTILVLDEATSSLDAASEANVIEALRKRDITCLVVAHRLSTIRYCDEIVVLQDGRVTERGSHDELMARDGIYARLVECA